MWQDMILYWAWRGAVPAWGAPATPATKRIEYADISRPGQEPYMRLAVTAFDDAKPRPVNRAELALHLAHGATASMSATSLSRARP